MCKRAQRETLCNHFYFPLLASLPSDLDCISHGRQRHYERMLAMDARACQSESVRARLFSGVMGSGGGGAKDGERTFQYNMVAVGMIDPY